MQAWLVAALAGAVFVGAHYTLLRAASGKIGDSLGAFVLEATAAVGILVAHGLLPKAEGAPTTKPGIAFSVASGLCISAVSILLFYALRKGGPVATTGTIVLGGGVTLSAALAPLLFGEAFTLRRAVGVGLGVLAIVVLSFDTKPAQSSPAATSSESASEGPKG